MILTKLSAAKYNIKQISEEELVKQNLDKLKKDIAVFVYVATKGDRQAVGTLNMDLISKLTGKNPQEVITQVDKSTKGEQQFYFDLQKLAWRNYKTSNLIAIIN